MTPEDLNFEGMQLAEAQAKATTMLKTLKKVKASKLNNLVRDIERARTTREVQRIMWYTHLASEGLRTVGSQWETLHRGI